MRPRKGGLEARAIGRSRGGPRTGIQAAADALGLPGRFAVTPGHGGGRPRAQGPIAGREGLGHLIAEAGCEADRLRRLIAEERGAKPQIQQNPTRAGRPPLDRAPYRERPLVACLFSRLTRSRRIARRCAKTVTPCRAPVALARAMTGPAEMKTPPKAVCF